MKSAKANKIATLCALFLGGFALAPGYAATSGQQTESQAQAPDSSPATGMSGPQANSPSQLMPDKIQQVCQSADKDHDGYISKTEFKALKKDVRIDFKSADASHAGRLDMQQCVKALSG